MTNASLKRGRRILDAFLQSRYFDAWQHDALGNNLFLTDPERADRMHEAAADGCDGSTHYERLQDMRDAFRDCLRDRRGEYLYRVEDAVISAIDAVEAWHENNGSLHEQIG